MEDKQIKAEISNIHTELKKQTKQKEEIKKIMKEMTNYLFSNAQLNKNLIFELRKTNSYIKEVKEEWRQSEE
ncbi:MAG: hypothetical protein ACOC5T_08320 [Elusimicrobiota bacterium]